MKGKGDIMKNDEIRKLAKKATFSSEDIENLAIAMEDVRKETATEEDGEKVRSKAKECKLDKEVQDYISQASLKEMKNFLQMARNNVVNYLVKYGEFIMAQREDMRKKILENYAVLFSKENVTGEFDKEILQEFQNIVQNKE